MNFNDQINLNGVDVLEEAEILFNRPDRRYRHWLNPFEDMGDTEFKKTYRLTKDVAENLIETLTPHMVAPTRISSMNIERKVLVALRLFASGSYQRDVGGFVNHTISQSAVSNAVEEVATALNQPQVFNEAIHMPRNLNECFTTRNRYYEKFQFPGVLGVIDCTHVAIYPPKNNDPAYPEAAYVNRKGYHSINVQLICDSEMKIINICARYPGSTHDSFIWNNSAAYRYMHNLHNNGHRSYYLIGDSGYGLRPWLQTPIPNAAPGSPEETYNSRFCTTRSLIECCNGVLKLRFRCLLKHRVLHYGPQKASKIINACAILHNLCITNNLPPVEFGDDEEDAYLDIQDYGMYRNIGIEPDINNGLPNRRNPELEAGFRLQQSVVRNYFTN